MSSWTHVPMIFSGKMSLRNKIQFHRIISLTLTWFEHAPFWSGVRRATIAPQDLIASLSFCLQINIFPFWKELTCLMSSWAHVPMISSGKMSLRNKSQFDRIISLTLTWFEHAPYWSGVRRATIAPQGLVLLISHYIFINVLPLRKGLIIY